MPRSARARCRNARTERLASLGRFETSWCNRRVLPASTLLLSPLWAFLSLGRESVATATFCRMSPGCTRTPLLSMYKHNSELCCLRQREAGTNKAPNGVGKRGDAESLKVIVRSAFHSGEPLLMPLQIPGHSSRWLHKQAYTPPLSRLSSLNHEYFVRRGCAGLHASHLQRRLLVAPGAVQTNVPVSQDLDKIPGGHRTSIGSIRGASSGESR